MSGITVGIDGSHNSHRALDWAVQEAATRHSGLTVLTVHPVIASWVTGTESRVTPCDSRAVTTAHPSRTPATRPWTVPSSAMTTDSPRTTARS